MARKVFFSRNSGQRFNAGKYRLRLHYHPVAAAKRAIVNDVLLVSRPLPPIVRRHFHQSGVARTPQNPTIYALAKELGKDRDDIEAQHLKDPKVLPEDRRRSSFALDRPRPRSNPLAVSVVPCRCCRLRPESRRRQF